MIRRWLAGPALVMILVMTGAGSASAADAGPLASVVNGNDPSMASGTNFDTVQVTAPAACDASATRHVTKIVRATATRARDQQAADAWVGDNLYSPVGVGLPGPLTVRSANSWQGLADTYGQKLVPATYEFVLRCQDNLGTVINEEWSGQVTFSSPKVWKGSTGAPETSGSTASAAPESPGAEPSPSPDDPATSGSAGSTSADPSASESSTSVLGSGSSDSAGSDSAGLAATGAKVAGISALGALFLAAGFGLVALSRRRRDQPPTRTGR